MDKSSPLLLLFLVQFCLIKLYNITIVDYWGIEQDVMSTWEYQYWPRQTDPPNIDILKST